MNPDTQEKILSTVFIIILVIGYVISKEIKK